MDKLETLKRYAIEALGFVAFLIIAAVAVIIIFSLGLSTTHPG